MIPLRHILLSKRGLLWALLLLGAALGLCAVPLFNVLGYEFSLVFALLASFAGAHLGVRVVAKTREADESLLLATTPAGRILVSLVLRAIGVVWLLLVLPLAAIALNALRVRNCDLLGGLGFFAMMPLLSGAIAATVGVLWGLTLRPALLASVAAIATLLLSLGWGVYRFYAAPAIFGYDPFVGYFPGTLYDEDIAIRAPFYWSRLQQLCWLAAALLLASRQLDGATLRICLVPPRRGRIHGVGRRSYAPIIAFALALGGALLLTSYRAELGFAVDASAIRRELGGIRTTRHFEIIHPKAMSREEVDRLAEDHEFRYAQLKTVFGADPTRIHPARIRSYIFANSEQKRRLMGAARVFIAKPWRREVYLQDEGFPHRVLKHELAHVFAGRFGDPTFAISFRWRSGPLALPVPHVNVGLIEGIAVATDWRSSGELDGHQRAAALFALRLAPPIEGLFGLGFLAQAGPRAYALAGSFCRYLLDRYGMDKLGAVYRNAGDFAVVYKKSLGTLIAEWRRFIAEVKVPPQALALAEARYRRPSILRRVCPHEIANLYGAARRARGDGDYDEAGRILERICRFEKGNPNHRIALMHTRAAAGGPRAGLALAPEILAHRSLSKPQRRDVLGDVGDWRSLSGDAEGAARAYAEAARLPAGAGGRRILALKRWALGQPDPLRRLLLDYLVVPPNERRRAAKDIQRTHQLRAIIAQRLALPSPLPPRAPTSAPTSAPASAPSAAPARAPSALGPYAGLGEYLLGKQLAARGEAELALEPLRRAVAAGLPAGDLRAEALRTLGISAYLEARFELAAKTFQTLLREAPSAGLKVQASDWLERCRWRQGRQASKDKGPGAATGSRLSRASRP